MKTQGDALSRIPSYALRGAPLAKKGAILILLLNWRRRWMPQSSPSTEQFLWKCAIG